MVNISNNNICEIEEKNNSVNSKILKGGMALSNNSYSNLQFGSQSFFDAKNKLNKSKRNSTNNLFNAKELKIKSSKKYLNQSCPLINKQSENWDRINEK